MINYHRDYFNCAHYAISEINRMHGADIKFNDGDAWQASFLLFLREKMKKLDRPIDGCLVVMSQSLGGLHLGIFKHGHVEHNYNSGSSGCVIMSDIGTIRSHYTRVRYYAPR